MYLEFVDNNFKEDVEIVKTAYYKDQKSLQFANKESVKTILKENYQSSISEPLKNGIEIFSPYRYISEQLKDD